VDHLSTFGLDRDPFGCDAQLLWYFEGAGFAAATQRLQRAALQGKGLCVVTGRGGVGKTMLVRHLLQVLEEEVYEASMLVAVPGITDLRWLLTRWAQQLGVESPASELAAVLAQLYEQLAIVREDGRKAVLIIDEAQVLAERGILAELRGLLNLEYEEKRLVTLVLVGAPSLAEALSAEPALRERIDLRVSLQPLQPREVVGYLHHRIRAAGGNPAILESSAVAALTKLCGGLPRRINAIADDALFHAHSQGRVSATAADVERAAGELDAGADAAAAASSGTPASGDLSLAPLRPERSALAAAPARRSKEAALPPAEALLGESGSDLELGDVVAEPSGRRGASAASATVVMAAARSLDDSAELAPEQGREFRLDDTGELEDLFADIVDE
jgi:type II secretory pathway predicted ATPase ExeA